MARRWGWQFLLEARGGGHERRGTTYGFKRAEFIVALLNAAALIAISALIVREALPRLFQPKAVRPAIMLAAAAAALVANAGSVLLLCNVSIAPMTSMFEALFSTCCKMSLPHWRSSWRRSWPARPPGRT